MNTLNSPIFQRFLLCFFLVLLNLPGPSASAQEYEEEYHDYNDLLSTLTQRTSSQYKSYDDPFATAIIHGAVGYVTSRVQLDTPDGETASGFLSGVEFSLGIDLFSPQWTAECSIHSFSKENIALSSVSLKEFDLKIIYKPVVTQFYTLRFGLGLAARYLDIQYKTTPSASGDEGDVQPTATAPSSTSPVTPSPQRYTTPSSIFLVGSDFFISKLFSVGFEISHRAPLIEETIEKTAFNANVSLSTHF